MTATRRLMSGLAFAALLGGAIVSHGVAGAVTAHGTPLTFGANAYGQLGDGSPSGTVRATPGAVPGMNDIIDIAGGREHVIALHSDGTVSTWGSDYYGQLGDGSADNSNHDTPVTVPGLSDVVDVDDGHYHSIALKSDGTVWTWGFGSLGQLGYGGTAARIQSPVQFGTLSNVSRVFGGRDMTYALLDDGTVWCAGSNANGECGPGAGTAALKIPTPIAVDGISDVVDMAGGRNHAIALKSDGTVWTWGLNAEGQLGDGTRTSHAVPRQVAGLSNIVDVGAGAEHSIAVTGSGDVYTWGWGSRGQLGLGDQKDRLVPTKVPGVSNAAISEAGRDHTLIITKQGGLITWGENANMQTGSTGPLEVLKPFAVPNLTDVVAAAGGQAYSVVLQGNGTTPTTVFSDGFDNGLAAWTGGARLVLDDSRYPPTGSPPSLRADLTNTRGAATHPGLPAIASGAACVSAEVRLESVSTQTTMLRLRADDGTSVARLIITKSRALKARADEGGVSRLSSTVVPLNQWHQLGLCAVRDSGAADQVAMTYDGTEVGRWTLDNGNAFIGQVEIGSTTKVSTSFNLDDLVVTVP